MRRMSWVSQMDEFVVQCERIGRTQNLDEIESHTEKDNKQQPFASISVLPECSESDGNEDEKQAEPKELVGRVVAFAAARICGGNISEAECGAQRDGRHPSAVKLRVAAGGQTRKRRSHESRDVPSRVPGCALVLSEARRRLDGTLAGLQTCQEIVALDAGGQASRGCAAYPSPGITYLERVPEDIMRSKMPADPRGSDERPWRVSSPAPAPRDYGRADPREVSTPPYFGRDTANASER